MYEQQQIARRMEWGRLENAPHDTPVHVGDRVLVAAGMLDHGHLRCLKEATVERISGKHYLISLTGHDDKVYLHWVERCLIVEVLGKSQKRKTVKVNLNSYCTVELTATGARLYNQYSSGLPYSAGDTKREQMWAIMNILGPALRLGADTPCDMEIEVEVADE